MKGQLSECCVLLKNDKDFTLEKPGRIALFGNGVRHTVKGGTGSGEVNSKEFHNIGECFEAAGFTVTTKDWLDAYDKAKENARGEFMKQIRAEAKKAHVNAIVYGMGAVMPEAEIDIPLEGDGEAAVYVLSRVCGEGNDRKAVRGDLLLTESEIRDILALNERFDKFLLALNVGGPVDLSPVLSAANILVLSQLGTETGNVLADLILGRTYPSGKLTTTWSAWEDYQTLGTFGDWDDTRYKEGIYVGYRYFDTAGKKPLFPFGFGLGFTTFEIKAQAPVSDGSKVRLSVSVKNTGDKSGKEAAQLYVSKPSGKLDQPYQVLAAFGKTKELAAGEETLLNLCFDMKDLVSYDEEAQGYVLEKGDYILRLGNSSADTYVCGAVRLDRDVTVTKTRNCLGKPDFSDAVLTGRTQELQPDVPVLSLSADEIQTRVVAYDTPEEADETIKTLTDEQLIYLSVGSFDEKNGIASVIGNASKTVAGAAGETSSAAKDQGIPPLVMADGPAGLRLAKDYTKDKKGVPHQVGNPLVESMADFLSPPLKYLMSLILGGKPKKGQKIYHQYCSAIPIGTAVAQSWNTDLAEEFGDIVGREMETFGVHLWLAPALNIHRSVLCGRNFEYYSEDPLISGEMAAAITRGVQKHPGCGVTVKHFAANNQETNRYASNSLVSERAMREIYLKGFEICVKSAKPHALMTSYNLLNGVHTSECRGLNTDILRSEFGFEGVVMTDWVVAGMTSAKSKYAAPETYKVAASGNEIFMPGSKKEKKNLEEALRAGKIARKQLEINITRVCRAAKLLGSKGNP